MLISALKKNRALKLAGVAVAVGGVVGGLALAGVFSGSAVEASSTKPPKGVKNVIVMISDGASYNHITATDYYTGKKQTYERFPVSLGVSTYEYEDTLPKIYLTPPQAAVAPSQTVKNLVGYDPVLMWKDFNYSAFPLATDSASAGTAIAGGKKTYNGAIGVDVTGTPVELISQRAEALGKATGIVTTVEWTHATPASFVAHNVSRNNYAAIAAEMINSSGTDVIMGAGNPDFDDNGASASPAKDAKYVGGTALWSALKAGTAGGDSDGDGLVDPWTLIQTKAQFESLATAAVTPERVLGTAQVYTTLQQARGGNALADPGVVPLNSNVPDLSTMARGALNVLHNDRDGFFLMVEGGAVDWAAHANQTGRTIEEEMDFNKAVDAVIAWVERNSNWDETLLIVTSDHETGNLWGPGAGTAADGTPKFTAIVNNGKGNVPGVSWNSPEHTNQLVPLFAKGEAGKYLQSYVRTTDPVRGPYIDNTNIADLLFKVVK